MTLEDYRDWLVEAENAGRRPYPVDRAAIEEEALRRTVTERLYPLEARRRGLDRRADMALWAQRKREDLMIEEVRRAAVEAPLLGEAAIARFLAEHTEQFCQPARVFVEAALAMTESDGRYLLQQCEDGGDLAAAATSRPLPAGTRTYRAFCLPRGAEETPGDEPQALIRAAAGFGEEWTGPSLVRLSTGGAAVQYAVLRLVERRAARAGSMEDDQVRRAVCAALLQARSGDLEPAFASFVSDLRQRWSAQVEYLSAEEVSPR